MTDIIPGCGGMPLRWRHVGLDHVESVSKPVRKAGFPSRPAGPVHEPPAPEHYCRPAQEHGMDAARYSTTSLTVHRSAPTVEAVRARKAYTRRPPDPTQTLRLTVQLAFLLLSLWIGVRFYFFVRFFENNGQTLWVPRPAGVEGWLPIASLMNLKAFVETGIVPEIHAAGMFLLMAFIAMSLIFRKAFCSWACPIGTISEWLWQGGREIFGTNPALPRWLDIPLRSLKYILLGLFLYAVGSMSAVEIRAFLHSPYGLIADVKMLDFFRAMSQTTAIVLVVLVVLSILFKNFWCRYLCPYGAMMALPALLSPSRIRRNPAACIDCGKCTKACPSLLPIDRLLSVRSAECTGCLECVSACPARGALDLRAARRTVPGWAVAAGVTFVFLAFVAYARWAGYWYTELPAELYFDLIPRAHELKHP
jgi:ferredoxin